MYHINLSKKEQQKLIFTSQDFFVESVERDDLPKDLESPEGYKGFTKEGYTKFYTVELNGGTIFYLAKGHENAPNQIILWYAATKKFNRSFGKTLKETITMGLESMLLYLTLDS
jgi:hypothetical protein